MLANTAPRIPLSSRISVDRYIFSFMSLLFLLVAIVGFAPRSAAILGGALPNPPLSVHIHAALMSAWLLLLVVQATLVAGHNKKLHMRLGLVTLVLFPAMLLAMAIATLQTFGIMVSAGVAGLGSNLLLLQIRGLILFPVFFIWAMLTRRSDPATHKRMMLLSTLILIDAAIARMNWLPGNNIELTYNLTFFYQFVLFAPALLYDRIRLGKFHKAYVWGLDLYLPWVLVTALLWNSSWWQQIAPALFT